MEGKANNNLALQHQIRQEGPKARLKTTTLTDSQLLREGNQLRRKREIEKLV